MAAALILRGEGPDTEVLLIQEAKQRCHGKYCTFRPKILKYYKKFRWYLPAGRVEAGETLIVSTLQKVKFQIVFRNPFIVR